MEMNLYIHKPCEKDFEIIIGHNASNKVINFLGYLRLPECPFCGVKMPIGHVTMALLRRLDGNEKLAIKELYLTINTTEVKG